MSSLIFGAMTRMREEAPADQPVSVKSYLDALAALVPSEVLGLHVIALSVTTTTAKNAQGEVVTTITDPATLTWVFWTLCVLSVVFYILAHNFEDGKFKNFMHWWDAVRALIPPFAFVGWTMLQKSTAFDAVFPWVAAAPRYLIAVFAGALLVAVTTIGASKADTTPPPAS